MLSRHQATSHVLLAATNQTTPAQEKQSKVAAKTNAVPEVPEVREEQEVFRCEECKKDFNTAENLARHKLSAHGKAVSLILFIKFLIDFGKFKS